MRMCEPCRWRMPLNDGAGSGLNEIKPLVWTRDEGRETLTRKIGYKPPSKHGPT